MRPNPTGNIVTDTTDDLIKPVASLSCDPHDEESARFLQMLSQSDTFEALSLNSMSNLSFALEYSAFGWFVFPCKADKSPMIQHGFHAASRDPVVIRGWWERYPKALIGGACGKSNIVVFDLDVKNGPNGIEAFEELCRKNRIDTTGALVSLSPSGGKHIIFSHDHSIAPIKCTASQVAQGIDVRGDGGYIILPPSRSTNGKYEKFGDWSSAPIELPPSLALVAKQASERTGKPPFLKRRGTTVSGNVVLSAEVTKMKNTEVGNRNTQLNKSGYRLGHLLFDGGLERDAIVSELSKAALASGLDEHEVKKTVENSINDGFKDAEKHEADVEVYLSDVAFSQAFAKCLRHSVLYCDDLSGWIDFNGKQWVSRANNRVMLLAKQFATQLYLEASAEGNEALRDAAKKYLYRYGLETLVSLVRSEPNIEVDPEIFDSNLLLLNCQNGIFNLETGTLQPHDPSNYCMRISKVKYDPSASCSQWFQFLSRITDNNDEMSSFLQRAVGYSMSGNTDEDCFFFLYGRGANGKSTFIRVISEILGDYAVKTRAETLYQKKGDNDGPNNDIARLKGARLVTASEMKSRTLNEALIKDMTGGDKLSARFLRKEYFDFYPCFKLWMFGNDLPTVKGLDEAFWRRVKLIPFLVRIPETEWNRHLVDDLLLEASGILNWMIEGYNEWKKCGLGKLPIIEQATSKYREEMDTVLQFIGESCDLGISYSCEATALLQAYQQWCSNEGIFPLSRRKFSEDLDSKGYQRSRDSRSTRYTRLGLRLKNWSKQCDLSVSDQRSYLEETEGT